MAEFQHKENSGSLFKNDSTNEKAPKYKGNAMINGKLMQVSMWEADPNSKVAFSLKFSEPFVPNQAPNTQTNSQGVPSVEGENDLPF